MDPPEHACILYHTSCAGQNLGATPHKILFSPFSGATVLKLWGWNSFGVALPAASADLLDPPTRSQDVLDSPSPALFRAWLAGPGVGRVRVRSSSILCLHPSKHSKHRAACPRGMVRRERMWLTMWLITWQAAGAHSLLSYQLLHTPRGLLERHLVTFLQLAAPPPPSAAAGLPGACLPPPPPWLLWTGLAALQRGLLCVAQGG